MYDHSILLIQRYKSELQGVLSRLPRARDLVELFRMVNHLPMLPPYLRGVEPRVLKHQVSDQTTTRALDFIAAEIRQIQSHDSGWDKRREGRLRQDIHLFAGHFPRVVSMGTRSLDMARSRSDVRAQRAAGPVLNSGLTPDHASGLHGQESGESQDPPRQSPGP